MTAFAMTIPDEMRKKYVERRTRDAEELQRAVAAGDFEKFQKVGHQLKGNAATFGYEQLADLGRRMEAAAERRDESAAQECVHALRAWIVEQDR